MATAAVRAPALPLGRVSVLGPAALPLLMLSAFLPYLHKASGLRAENLLGALLAVLALAVLSVRGTLLRSLTPVLLASAALFVLVVTSTLLGESAPGYLKSGIGRFDHYFRPLSIVLVGSVAFHGTSREARERALLQAIRVLLIAASVNTLLQIASMAGNIDGILAPFRPAIGRQLEVTVAELAAQNNRFTGIFNQPLEHGLVYSMALLSCVYVWRHGGVSRTLLLLSVGLVFLGGVLALSKVFLLGGVPVALMLALGQGGIRPKHVLGALVAVVVTGAVGWTVFSRWEGADAVIGLAKMLADPETALYAFSGGRIGNTQLGEEIIIENMLMAFRRSPLFGVGTASGITLQDNEYLMTLAECGIVGLSLLAARMFAMLVPAMGARRRDPVLPLFLAIVAVAVGGGLGGPVSGIPRSGTVLWVLYVLLAAIVVAPRPPAAEARA